MSTAKPAGEGDDAAFAGLRAQAPSSMLTIAERISCEGSADDRLILPFDRRQKSRLRVTLESGDEAAVNVERGAVLRGGDRLRASDGRIVLVVAAKEPLTLVTATEPGDLMRAAY